MSLFALDLLKVKLPENNIYCKQNLYKFNLAQLRLIWEMRSDF